MRKILWEPTEERKRNANITRFMEFVNKKYSKNFRTYEDLYRWSTECIPEFWDSVWEFCDVRASRKYDRVVEDLDKFPGARWFSGARLNFAENLLRFKDEHVAFTFIGEGAREKRSITYKSLYEEVAKMSNALKSAGVKKGDRVVAYMPNLIETAVAMLGASSIGAIWASCGPELGIDAVMDRIGQLEPSVLFATDGYIYKGRIYSSLKNLELLSKRLSSLKKVIVFGYLQENPELRGIEKSVSYGDFLSGNQTELVFEELPPDHPHIVLFSSGVTGKSKCIVHSLAGSLIVHLKTHMLHFDIKREDRVLFLSSPTWMVWNLQISCLATGCNVILYDGNPFYPDFHTIWKIVEEEKVTCLGCGAAFILTLMQNGIKPKDKHDLSSLKTIFQTAAPLSDEGFEYVYEAIKKDVCLLSGLGGTDVQCGIIEGSPIQHVYKGQMPSAALGFAVRVYDENGRPLLDRPGELVVEKPFPSTPLYFWGDSDGTKYRETYFSLFPNIWRHGDFAIQNSATGGFVGLGRSDFVLKPSGVRIGPAEIYNVVEKMEEIEDSVVVGQYVKGDQRIILFVKLKKGHDLTEELKERIRRELSVNASPRHVPAKILAVPEIPYTVNMKKVESAVFYIVNGRPVPNRGSLINPECLDYYEKLAEEELKE